MRIILAAAALAVLTYGCSNSPSAPGGTLPVVQNCRIVTGQTVGDTVTVAWDPVEAEVDGYRVWFATTDPGNWDIIAQVEGTTTEHIATSTGFYCVDAIKGIDSSESQSNKADDRAEMFTIEDTLSVWGDCGIRFLPSQAVIGDATDPSFAQDLYISWQGDDIVFRSGGSDPDSYPGGTESLIAEAGNTVAYGPGDPAWKLTVTAVEGRRYFVALENGDYALFWVDTVFDSLVMLDSGQYQTIPGLRLFNVFVF